MNNPPRSASWSMLQGLSWLTMGMLFGRLAMWLARIAAARMIGKAALGEFGLVESTVAMFASYATLGMAVAVSKNLADSFLSDPQRAGRIIGTVCLISGSVFLIIVLTLLAASDALAVRLGVSPGFLTSLRIGTLLSLLVPSGLLMAMLNAFQAFRHTAFSYIIQGLVTLTLTLALAPYWGLNGVLLSFGLGVILMFAYQIFNLRRICRRYGIAIDFRGFRQEGRLIWRYGLPSMLAGFLVNPVNWATRAILAKEEGGLDELGLYVGALSICSVFIACMSLLYSVMIPVLAATSDPEERAKATGRNIFLHWYVALCLSLPLIVLSEPLVKLLLGAGFSNSGAILAILGIALGIRFFCQSLQISLIVNDRVWYMSFCIMAGEAAFLVAAIYAIPLGGANGLAAASLLGSTVSLCLYYVACTKTIGFGKMVPSIIIIFVLFAGGALLVRNLGSAWVGVLATGFLLFIVSLISLRLSFSYGLLDMSQLKSFSLSLIRYR